MPGIMVTDDPLICLCGKPTKVYDSLFKRNFCDGDCSAQLMRFLGGCDKSIAVMAALPAAIKAGDFKIQGSVVTLGETLQRHQEAKTSVIDKIDAQVDEQLKLEKLRKEFKKKFPQMPDAVIDAMVKAGG